MTRRWKGVVVAVIAALLAVGAQAAKKPSAGGAAPGGGMSLSDVNLRALDAKPSPPAKEWGRDPFLPPPKASIEEGPLELTAVILGNGRAVAIINKRIYRVGDMVSNRVIEQILQDRVILSDANGTIELRVQSLSDERLDGKTEANDGIKRSGKASSER